MNSQDKKIRLAFIIPNLEKGGAERVLVHLVNQMDYNRYEPFIFCLKKRGALLTQVNPQVSVLDINYPRVYFSIFSLRKQIRKVNPSVVIGWLGNVNAILAFYRTLLPKRITVMCRESSIPSLFNRHYTLPFLFNFFYRFYNRFDGIICQSVAMKKDLVDNFKVDPGRIKMIHNPVAVADADESSLAPDVTSFIRTSEKLLLFVGRFSPEKQTGLILDTMLLLPAGYRLLLIGYGPLQQQVNQKIAETGMENRVRIIDNCSNPAPYYKLADCFVLASSFEGFPNVLLEANAQGCPVVVYKTKGGAKEIITPANGIYIEPGEPGGLQRFAGAIKEVCGERNQYDRKKIAATVLEQFNVQKTTESYMTYITEIMSQKNQ